jgi:hypothetical protein
MELPASVNQNSETETLQRTTRIHTSTSTSTRAGRGDRPVWYSGGTGSAGSRTWLGRPPPSLTAPIRGGAGPGCRRPAGGAVGRRGGGMNAVNAGRPSLLAPAPSPRCCVPVSPLRRSSSSVVGVAGAGDWRPPHAVLLRRPGQAIQFDVGGVRTEGEGKRGSSSLTPSTTRTYAPASTVLYCTERQVSVVDGWFVLCEK